MMIKKLDKLTSVSLSQMSKLLYVMDCIVTWEFGDFLFPKSFSCYVIVLFHV